MIRNIVEMSEEINGRKHAYTCPSDSPCDEVIAYCKVLIEHCEKIKEEAAKKEEPAEEVREVKPEETIIEVEDVGCCSC